MTRSRPRPPRRLRALLAGGLALLLASGAAACAGGARQAVKAEATTVSARLTVDEARQAFRTYVSADAVARASGDERLALSLTTDGQASLTAAAYRTATFAGTPVPRYRYGTPALYVPRMDGFPQWFAAVTDRTQGNTTRTAVMVFTREEPDGLWRLSLETLLDPKVRLPRIVVDKDGYVEALRTDQHGLVAVPKMVGALQATMVEEGPDGPAAGVVQPGPYTSGLYSQIRRTRRQMKDQGFAYDAIFAATSFPFYALRTADGGGLVLYAFSEDAVTLPKSKLIDRVPVPEDAAPLLERLVIRHELDVDETHQYAALDPPARHGKIRVIGDEGAVTRATGR